MPLKYSKIIITSDEPYSNTWHTQLIYTEYLSKLADVIFVNPPKKWKFSNLLKWKIREAKVNEHLSVINYKNIFPASIGAFNSFNEWYTQTLIRRRVKNVIKKPVLVWHFDSFRNNFSTKAMNGLEIKRVYHVIDPFFNNPIDQLLSRLADLIVITSPKNNKHYASHSKKIINIPQCIDLDASQKLLQQEITSPQKLPQDFLVLLGTISDDIDFEWLLDLTTDQTIQLVIIGKVVVTQRTKSHQENLFKRKNIYYLGELPPSEFYPVIKKALAGLIIYNAKRRTGIFSPLKAINYLAAGLPIITNSDCEISGLDDHCIYTVSDPFEFKEKVRRSVSRNLPFDTDRANNYLQSVSIKNAVDVILSKL